MKKLLIASTALVATASVAAAEINFSGYGRFGLLYEEDRAEGEETRFESRFRLNIDGVTTTDGGVRFAARIRVEANDNADNTADAGSFGGARFQVSAGGFRVRAGNISGVTDAAEVVNYFGFEPGLIGQTGQYANFGASFDAFASSSAGGAEGAGGVNGINVKYEVGDFAIMGSYSEDQDENDDAVEAGREERIEIGASYTFGAWTVGGVYGDAESDGSDGGAEVDNDWWVLTASGSIGPADVVFFVGDSDNDDDATLGISGSFPVGASTDIVASISDGGDNDNDTSYGIGFAHSLGGGVSLSGMVGSNADDNTIADLGVRFNF
ncbi:MAG: porin [Roseobacter sp.]